MDINQVPKQSGRLKLSDVDPYLIALEGPADDEAAAWVVIKVASTDDNRRRDDMLRLREMRYLNKPDDSLVFAEISKPTGYLTSRPGVRRDCATHLAAQCDGVARPAARAAHSLPRPGPRGARAPT